MKSMIIRAAAAVAVFTVISAAPVAAQVANPIGFNVRAGAALPVGEDSDGINTGFTIGAGLTMRPAMLPVGLRFDGDYNRFGTKDIEGDVTIWALTANAELAPAAMPIYFIGGLGFYSSKVSLEGLGESDSETDLGFNGGVGLRLPLTGFSTFVEARYHSIGSEGGRTNYIPIVFGVNF